MRRNTFSNRLKSLIAEKQIMAIASLITLIACFLPWYGINSRSINQWVNAFGSIGSVAGYLVLGFSVVTLGIILLPILKSGFDIQKKLSFKESSLLLFLSAQSFFVTLIFIPVYSQFSLTDTTSSGTRFGIYIALISTLVSTIVALSYHRKGERLALQQEDFVQVPRTQKSINEWSEEGESDEFESEEKGLEQETMFQSERSIGEENPEETLIQAEGQSAYHEETEEQPEQSRYYRDRY